MKGVSRFFVDRPVVGCVAALGLILAGMLAIGSLPIAQYPAIAPPTILIKAIYPGAGAETLETSVAQPIEQQLNGVDGLTYYSSASQENGEVNISVTFAAKIDPDIAQVQVQNRVQQAASSLPTEVQQQGVSVTKSQSNTLVVVTLYDQTGQTSEADIADYVSGPLFNRLSRLQGVGDVQLVGRSHAMRVWLDPLKLNAYSLSVSDIRTALLSQNVQVSGGQIGGAPTAPGNQLNASVVVQSRLTSAEQFRKIILRTTTAGAVVRLGDVARVEMGSASYDLSARYNGHAAAGLLVKPAPGANALATVAAIKAEVARLRPAFPPGVAAAYPLDNTNFVKLSIRDVALTLVVATILVIGVMYLFLRNWRATVIPTVTVPIVMLGTFAILAIAGYSINTLTLFAMVLAIGLVVDDAIVVVENVQRIIHEEGLSPRTATLRSMESLAGALIGIAVVLAAVFLPMGFLRNATGAIYRQFAVTIVSAMALSVLVALTLTPTLCALMLKSGPLRGQLPCQRADTISAARRLTAWYDATLHRILHHRGKALAAYGVLVLVLALLLWRLPTGFIPNEDQGGLVVVFNLPSGAVQTRTLDMARRIEAHLLTVEKRNVDGAFVIIGYGAGGTGQNRGTAFVHLRDWKERKGAANSADAIAQRVNAAFFENREAQVFALTPSPVPDLGDANGFDLELEDQAGLGHAALTQAKTDLLQLAAKDPKLIAVRLNGQDDAAQLKIDIDPERAGALGLSQADIAETLSTALGGTYVNQFVEAGRAKPVFMQGDASFRMTPDNLEEWYVRTRSGTLAPVSAFASSRWEMGPKRIEHYNGQPSMEIAGDAATGVSSGAAMAEMERLVHALPQGIGIEWTGRSFQERLSRDQAPLLYGLSLLVVFLCLAALYGSWTIPLSVLLVIPVGLAGAVLAATLRGYFNDIYFQVAMLTTVGLAAKNAILIIEFAVQAEASGLHPVAASIQAARLRLRPILITSMAFGAGVAPLALASGAGASSQNELGTAVVGGVVTGTVLAIFVAPLFFVCVRLATQRKSRDPRETAAVS